MTRYRKILAALLRSVLLLLCCLSSDCFSQKRQTFRILLRVKKKPSPAFFSQTLCLPPSWCISSTKQSLLVFCSWVFPVALITCLWACLSCESSDLLWSHFFLFHLFPCLFQFNFIPMLSHYGKWFLACLLWICTVVKDCKYNFEYWQDFSVGCQSRGCLKSRNVSSGHWNVN